MSSVNPGFPVADSDDYVGDLPVRLDAATLRELSRVRPLVSILHIGLEWTLAVGAAAICWHFWFNPLLFALAVMFIGARQHALIILMHEGAHRRLFRSRTVNDWVTELLLAWPLVLVSMHSYRRNHFPHHRYLNTNNDPDWTRKQTADWRFPKTKRDMARVLAYQGLGLGIVRFVLIVARLPKSQRGGPDNERAFRVARRFYFAALVIAILWLGLGVPVLLLWIVPFVTWTQLAFHIRSMAEHFGIHDRVGIWSETRTVVPTMFDRLFLVPKNVGYHIEHHLYPSVPFFRLRRLHALLDETPQYRQHAAVTRGYGRLLGELVMSHEA
jgi:fatty acid desaturase